MSGRVMLAGIDPVERRKSGGAGTSHPCHPALAGSTVRDSSASAPRGRGTRHRIRRVLWRHFGRYLEPRPVMAACIVRRSVSRRVAS